MDTRAREPGGFFEGPADVVRQSLPLEKKRFDGGRGGIFFFPPSFLLRSGSASSDKRTNELSEECDERSMGQTTSRVITFQVNEGQTGVGMGGRTKLES